MIAPRHSDSSILPLPCPFCGSNNASPYSVKSNHSVLCVACGGEGPEQESDDEAIAAWNRRQSAAAPPIVDLSDERRVADYEAGWNNCAIWARREDLLSDTTSPAYIKERDAALRSRLDGAEGALVQPSTGQKT